MKRSALFTLLVASLVFMSGCAQFTSAALHSGTHWYCTGHDAEQREQIRETVNERAWPHKWQIECATLQEDE